jgi:uncharacterized damage-inducible protein DinB
MLKIAAVCLTFWLCAGLVVAQKIPPQSKTIPDAVNMVWKSVSKDFVDLAEAMPEEKWGFRPTEGAYKNVRTFSEQVKHAACANEAWAKQMAGEKPPARCDLGGPNPAKSKAEIMAYLKQSFNMLDDAIAATTEKNLLTPARGPYWGDNRMSEITAAVWHMSDHYGQLVEYLRMNGIVPPASR